jgi:hypothetical protein
MINEGSMAAVFSLKEVQVHSHLYFAECVTVERSGGSLPSIFCKVVQ